MKRALGKALNIRPREWSRLAILYLMIFIFMLGWVWGVSVLEAGLLRQVGIGALPWFFVIKAIISIPAVAAYAAFADRVSNGWLLIAILLVSVVAIAIGLGMLWVGLVGFAFPLLYLLLYVPLEDIFITHWYTYVNDFFDTRSAKRVIPVLGTATILSGIVGGITVPFVSSSFSTSTVVLVWVLMLVAVAALVWVTPQWLRKRGINQGTLEPGEINPTVSEGPETSYLGNIREGYNYITQSSLLRWMALSTLLVMAIMALLQYQTSQVLLDRLVTEENIAEFIGWVYAIGNIIALPLQLFVMSRVIARIGVGNANLIFPAGNFVFSSVFVGLPNVFTAGLAYFNRTRFFDSIGYLTDGLIYNAVPLRVKGRVRAFIGGLIFPIGSLVGGVILLIPFVVDVPWLLSGIIVALSAGYVVCAVIIRKKYSQALIQMLEEEDYSFLWSQNRGDMLMADPATLAVLRRRLEEHTNDELTVFTAKLMSQVGGSDALPVLVQVARAAESGFLRSSLVDILNVTDARSDEVRQLYIDFLTDADARVRQSALAALEDVFEADNPVYLDLALGMLEDDDIDVRTQALLPLLGATVERYRQAGVEAVTALVSSDAASLRARGVRVIARTGQVSLVHHLVDALADQADVVRLEAAVGLESLVERGVSDAVLAEVVTRLGELVFDPIERVRMAALVVLGHLDDWDSSDAFVSALLDNSPRIRKLAIETLVRVGRAWSERLVYLRRQAEHGPSAEQARYQQQLHEHRTTPGLGRAVFYALQAHLESDNEQLYKMVAVVLSQIDREQYGTLIGRAVSENLRVIYLRHGVLQALGPLSHYRAVALLQSALRERNSQLLDEVFFLLGAVNNADEVKLVADALRSDAAHVRANATEALESLTSPHVAWLIEPLFDPEVKVSNLLEMAREMWNVVHPDTVVVVEQLSSDTDPWLRAMMTYALGEIGQGLAPAKKESPPPTDGRRARRGGRSMASLLGALEEDSPAPDDSPGSNGAPTDSVADNGSGLRHDRIEALIQRAQDDAEREVRLAAMSAHRMLGGQRITESSYGEESSVLSTIERIIFLKGVPFFQGMTVEQLKVLATVCEEKLFVRDTRIVNQGDSGGTLYVVVSGKVAIEQEKRKGYFARLSTVESHSYFGEANLFDSSPYDVSALAVSDTLVLLLRREPLVALARQYPDLSLELINVLSARLRESNGRVAELTRTRPRELHKLFDQFE
jgi:HEAT repeat protein